MEIVKPLKAEAHGTCNIHGSHNIYNLTCYKPKPDKQILY